MVFNYSNKKQTKTKKLVPRMGVGGDVPNPTMLFRGGLWKEFDRRGGLGGWGGGRRQQLVLRD